MCVCVLRAGIVSFARLTCRRLPMHADAGVAGMQADHLWDGLHSSLPHSSMSQPLACHAGFCQNDSTALLFAGTCLRLCHHLKLWSSRNSFLAMYVLRTIVWNLAVKVAHLDMPRWHCCPPLPTFRTVYSSNCTSLVAVCRRKQAFPTGTHMAFALNSNICHIVAIVPSSVYVLSAGSFQRMIGT